MPDHTFTVTVQSNLPAFITDVKTATTALEGLDGASSQAKTAIASVAPGAETASTAMGSLAEAAIATRLAMIGMNEIKEILVGITQAYDEAREYAAELAKENIKVRDGLRELKFARGDTPDGDRTSEAVLDFAQKTALHKEEAAEFLKKQAYAVDALPQALKPTPEMVEAVGIEAGRLTARADMDPAAMGKIAGTLPRYGVKTAEQGREAIAKISNQLKKATFDFKAVMPQFVTLLGEMAGDGGRISKPEDVAAVYAAATPAFGTAAQAKTGLKQTNRLLRRLDGKEGAALKEMGVTADDDLIAALRKVAPHVTGGKGDRFLKERGFGNDTEIASVIKYAKALPAIEEGLKENDRPGQGAEMVAANREGLNLAPELRDRVAQDRLDASKFARGKEEEDLVIARKEGEARLQNPNQKGGPRIDTGATNATDSVVDAIWRNPVAKMLDALFHGGDSPLPARQQRIDSEVKEEFIRNERLLGRKPAPIGAMSKPDPQRLKEFDVLQADPVRLNGMIAAQRREMADKGLLGGNGADPAKANAAADNLNKAGDKLNKVADRLNAVPAQPVQRPVAMPPAAIAPPGPIRP